jgi:hypothetical protein
MRCTVVEVSNVSPRLNPDYDDISVGAEEAHEHHVWAGTASRLPSPAAFIALLRQPSCRVPINVERRPLSSAGGGMP